MNSKLATYVNISPNQSGRRNHAIDGVSVHCVAAQWTAKQTVDYLSNPEVEASCNYAVGYDGSIAVGVDECDRSWCTSSGSNDNRMVTIEVASDGNYPYAVTDAAIRSLLCLLTDICRRNGIKKLLWRNDPNLIGHPDQQNMTLHRWFACKACPGEYLASRHGWIAKEVNNRINSGLPYVDVATDDWFYDSVKWATENGITSGISDLLFNPEGSITRAQAITMLWQVHGAPEPKTYQEFSDVLPSDYYCRAAQWARENGITSGIGNGKFGPDNSCTRAQIVTFMHSSVGSPDANVDGSFRDVPEDEYYAEPAYWAKENGITAGVTENLFAPDNPCTRAQVVTMLHGMVVGGA